MRGETPHFIGVRAIALEPSRLQTLAFKGHSHVGHTKITPTKNPNVPNDLRKAVRSATFLKSSAQLLMQIGTRYYLYAVIWLRIGSIIIQIISV
jgi:hypothetical protein